MDSVKTVSAAVESSAAELTTRKFKLNLGDDQVAILNAVRYHVLFTAVINNLALSVYRKNANFPTDIKTTGLVVEDTNHLFWGKFGSGLAAYTGKMRTNEFINMPKNLVLVRSPSLIVHTSQADNMSILVTLYYTIKNASKKDISELLMKYHS